MRITFKTKDEAPEEVRGFLKEVEENGTKIFALPVVPKDRLDEFRNNNTKLSGEKETLTGRLAKLVKLIPEGKTDDDLLTEVDELRKTAQLVKDGKIKGSEAIEAEVTSRVDAMRRANDETVQNLTKELGSWKEKAGAADLKYRRSIVDTAVMSAATDPKIGVNPKAMAHILNAARDTFQVADDGKLVPKDSGGNTIWGEDGSTPMTLPEWFKKLRTTDEYFFLGSTGGGAGGGNGGAGGLSAEQLSKLSPQERLRIANEQPGKQRR